MDCSDSQEDIEDQKMETEVHLPASPIRIQDSEEDSPPVIRRKKRLILESSSDEDDDLTPKVSF